MVKNECSRFKKNRIAQAWLVLVLSLCFGSSLASVEIWLSPKIEANKINETREKVPALILGEEKAAEMAQQKESLDIVSHQFSVEKQGRKAAYNGYEIDCTPDLIKAMEKCPQKRLVFVGTPTPKDLEKTRDEVLPEVIAVDFKTTVDDTEWRG